MSYLNKYNNLTEDTKLQSSHIQKSPLFKAWKNLKNNSLNQQTLENKNTKDITAEDSITLYEAQQDDYYKKEYCKLLNLPADTQITNENFDEYSFLHACNLNGWLYERAYKGIMGEYPDDRQ